MSIDRPESDGPPMFDLTKQPDAHTYHREPSEVRCPEGLPTGVNAYYRSPITNGQPRPEAQPIGTPTITILVKQLYSNDLYREHHVRIDCYDLLHSKARAHLLERAVLDALATIGVKL